MYAAHYEVCSVMHDCQLSLDWEQSKMTLQLPTSNAEMQVMIVGDIDKL